MSLCHCIKRNIWWTNLIENGFNPSYIICTLEGQVKFETMAKRKNADVDGHLICKQFSLESHHLTRNEAAIAYSKLSCQTPISSSDLLAFWKCTWTGTGIINFQNPTNLFNTMTFEPISKRTYDLAPTYRQHGRGKKGFDEQSDAVEPFEWRWRSLEKGALWLIMPM